jgi:hypothetical protein
MGITLRPNKIYTKLYDVWHYELMGNRKEGFEVNDRHCIARYFPIDCKTKISNAGTPFEFWNAQPSAKQIRAALGIKPTWPIEIDGDDLQILVSCGKTGAPLGELNLVGKEIGCE